MTLSDDLTKHQPLVIWRTKVFCFVFFYIPKMEISPINYVFPPWANIISLKVSGISWMINYVMLNVNSLEKYVTDVYY